MSIQMPTNVVVLCVKCFTGSRRTKAKKWDWRCQGGMPTVSACKQENLRGPILANGCPESLRALNTICCKKITDRHFRINYRHQVNGVRRGGGQAVFNQNLTRLVKIRLKSGGNPLKSCVFRGTRRTPTGPKKQNPVKSVRPHLRTTPLAQCRN